MNELFNILKGIAPTLATAVAGPLGGAAVTALASKFGVSDSIDAVAKAIAGDPQAAEKLQELELEYAKLDAQDRDSARKAYAAVATSENATKLEKLVVPILALGVVGLAFGLIGILMFVDTPNDQQQLVIFALGFITSAAGQVLSFYFGSSQGSKDKTEDMKGMVKK
jgi:Na+-transporting NADH:ubiquinone oxidoreductase subunit NqrC